MTKYILHIDTSGTFRPDWMDRTLRTGPSARYILGLRMGWLPFGTPGFQGNIYVGNERDSEIVIEIAYAMGFNAKIIGTTE